MPLITRLGSLLFRWLPAPDHLLAVERMRLACPHLAAEMRDVHLDLFLAPAQSVSHEENEALSVGLESILSEPSHLLESGVLWPSTDRTLVNIVSPVFTTV